MNGYILNSVMCFDNRGLTMHYDTKVRFYLNKKNEITTARKGG